MSGSILSDLLSTITERGHALIGRDAPKAGSGLDGLIGLCDALLSGQGEATGMAIARDVLDRFAGLDAAGRRSFFERLADDFGTDTARLGEAIDAWRGSPTEEHAADLHFVSEPRRQELFRRLNRAPGGTEALVAMRAHILDLLADCPRLATVDRDLMHLLSSWFNRGFLVVRRIDWATPANVLEKIIRYEAVHEIGDWNDLRRRIDLPDRRCYAFFHPALGDEPLIFVQVALTRAMPDAIGPILATKRDPVDPRRADTAVFYSISNCQRGLRGVSFGSFLIKQVVDEVGRDLPQVQTFVTLSPLPGFTRWLGRFLEDEAGAVVGAGDRAALARLETNDWVEDGDAEAALKAALLPLAAHYLLRAKKTGGEPVDPVARFHLGNGARLERVNWLGDRSRNGLKQAAGLMVNYRYDLKDIEKNHEAYANHGEIAASSGVTRLLKAFPHKAAPV